MFLSSLQAIRLKYQHPDSELQNFALQVMDMLGADTCIDAHPLVFLKNLHHRFVFILSSTYEYQMTSVSHTPPEKRLFNFVLHSYIVYW